MSYKPHFSRFLSAAPTRLHLAAHSHHLRPDVTREAHIRAWDDAARLADAKWGMVFGELIPSLQRHVARHLNLPDPTTIAVAPNTHDLLRRLLSCLEPSRPARILATDGEFHTCTRQVSRLEEENLVLVERVPVEPLKSFARRFCAAAGRGGHDLVFFSHVFFNSGFAVPDLEEVIAAVPDDSTLIAIDAYHGFLALPTDLEPIADRAFYMAGGYKYAMAGEGACFLHCPPGYGMRPRDTGWFAAFGALSGKSEGVPFGEDGTRFLGATFDPTALYRFNAVMDWLDGLGLTVADIHAHVMRVQEAFLAALRARPVAGLDVAALVVPPDMQPRGHFLTFRTQHAGDLRARLSEASIVTDFRGDRLRLGFGLYHDAEDAPEIVERLGMALGWA